MTRSDKWKIFGLFIGTEILFSCFGLGLFWPFVFVWIVWQAVRES
jgi:hypothetical protein